MDSQSSVKLGSLVRDTITGFEGVVIARTEWLYGCSRLTVQARELKDGKTIEGVFDEPQVMLLQEHAAGISVPSLPPAVAQRAHGGRPDTGARRDA